MNLKIVAQKLRKAADLLDELMDVEKTSHETPEVAKAIREDLPKNRKIHWTQTARGRKLLSKNSRKFWANRKAVTKAA